MLLPLVVTPVPSFKFLYKFQEAPNNANVIAVVRFDESISPTFILVVTALMPARLFSSTTAMSWASGRLFADNVVLPLDVAQLALINVCAVAEFQYTVLGASNVMLVLFPQSPRRVPLTGDAAPEIVMSRKSQSDGANVATVSVLAVLVVLLKNEIRCKALVPDVVNVPLIVWFADNVIGFTPGDAGAVIVQLLNVFSPVIELFDALVDVKDTL